MSTLGIVLVSHVPEVVEGLNRLLAEVASDVSITLAGGTEERSVGTSFEKIQMAFEDNQGEKLLAFYDLGSAKMNLEMAMELADKEVILYDTALIESAYTAAALVQAGASFEAIDEQLQPLKIK